MTLALSRLNFRDIGGLPTRDGRQVRPGILYRSEGPASFLADHHAELAELGFRTVADLRSDMEREKAPHDWCGADCRILDLDMNTDLRAQGEDMWMTLGRDPTQARAIAVMTHNYGLMPQAFLPHVGPMVDALLAGDTVVFKPSEETPLAGQMLVEALEAAGVPAGVINLVQGGRETGQALIADEIDGLLFTGSAQAGAFFRRYFADRPDVILALELGGNNPLVVWDAGDAEAAAALVVQSAFITTGQRCSCARRLIVSDDAAGRAVIEAVAALSDRLTAGPWNGPSEPFMGPLISARAAALAQAGAEALGGRRIRTLGGIDGLSDAFVSPGFVDVTGVEVADEELFAPLLQVRRVTSFDEAIVAANATRYGLSAGLISNQSELWGKFLNRIRAGVVNWNRPTTGAAGSMPFGGLGASGNHRPSAYYAADYCAYPVASFEADAVLDTLGDIKGLRA